MIKFLYKMNLECLNNIITNNLAIHIDLTDFKSWDLNTGLTSFSLTKWSGAVSDNINLLDFGLTGFDNGRTNEMWGGIYLTPEDNVLSLYRVGYNIVENPDSGETSGVIVNTEYLPITAITSGETGNYFQLGGGYLQGFFKLDGYNYEVLPARYNNGITIETLLNINSDSQGIFYMMGARAEDKYNPYFSGETMTGSTISGVTTSEDNFLDALEPYESLNSGFSMPEEDMYTTKYTEAPPIDNIKNNAIAFELTQDKRLAYKYVNNDGLIITNSSPTTITQTGFTIITIVFTPNNTINDLVLLECIEQRLGKLIFYVNGRAIWINKDFPEFYFKGFSNDKEKQEGVPYSISWGGGSFGLKESWHYDYQTYMIYNGDDETYVNSKFTVEEDPISTECYTAPTGNTYLDGLSLSADTSTFTYDDPCDSSIEHPLTVLRIEYTGGTGTTYFVKFKQPISMLSNRDYVANLLLFNDGFFNADDNNKISILMYSDDVDINVVDDTEYILPLSNGYLHEIENNGLHPFPDRQEYEWVVDGIKYYGETGYPVTSSSIQQVGYVGPTESSNGTGYISGEMRWLPMSGTFRTPDNTGQNFVYMGLLIETNGEFNSGGTLFINNFTYTAADILVQDDRKSDFIIGGNFDSSFDGGIQKLRIYDKAFTSPEVLHNALIESQSNPNIVVSKGGRIIYR